MENICRLQLKTPLGKRKFDALAKTVKCALSLSHGNADNERSLSVNKKILTKERSNLSTITLNGLRATEDGVKSLNGLSHITVTKDMSYVKDSHKAYMEHIETERKKELKKRCNNAELEEMKKKRKGKVEKLRN